MKNLTYLLAVVFLVSCAQESEDSSSQQSDKNQEPKFEKNMAGPQEEEELVYDVPERDSIEADLYPWKGTIGDETVYMDMYFEENEIHGSYMYLKYGKPIQVKGHYFNDGFVLEEYDEEGKVVAYFNSKNGRFDDFQGDWIRKENVKDSLIIVRLMNFPRHYMSHIDGRSTHSKRNLNTTFILRKGLDETCEDCVSFETGDYPGGWLYTKGNELYRLTPQNKTSATFRLIPGLADSTKFSIESYEQPGMVIYVRHNKYFLEPISTLINDKKKQLATFTLSPFYLAERPTGITPFHLSIRDDFSPESEREIRSNVKYIEAKFDDFSQGDAAHFEFVGLYGDNEHFDANFDENFELASEKAESERLDEYDYYGPNLYYKNKWFEISYYYTWGYLYPFGPPGPRRIIQHLKMK